MMSGSEHAEAQERAPIKKAEGVGAGPCHVEEEVIWKVV